MNKLRIVAMRSRGGEAAFYATSLTCALFAVGIALAILLTTFVKGAGRISWDFLVTPSNAIGTEGGILYQLLGTMILLVTAAAAVAPVAYAIAIADYHIASRRLKSGLRSILHLLNATPSILFGILGFVFFVNICGWNKSWLGGGLILALMILPTVTLAIIHRLETIPEDYIDAATALGLNPDALIRSVLVPYSYGGLLTGIVMGIARAAGETAPIMFTAVVFFGATMPSGIRESPVLALPYHIFNLAQDVLAPEALTSAWATAFFLIALVLMLSLAVTPFRSRGHEEAKR